MPPGRKSLSFRQLVRTPTTLILPAERQSLDHLAPDSGPGRKQKVESPSELSFFTRHEFLIRRLHSLTGLIPVGAYMCVHLLTNASVLAGAATFQDSVDKIHSLGPVLPLVEWTFIFLPIIFHAVVGVVIIRSGQSNLSS